MIDFFVSYTASDKHWAEWIAWVLEDAGRAVIIQAWDFLPGQNFVLKMQEATTNTDATIIVLSKAFMSAMFTQPEWAAAFAQDPTGTKRKLIPVRIDDVKPDGMLKPLINIDLVGLDQEAARAKLLEGTGGARAKPPKAPPFPGAAPNVPPSFPGTERNIARAGIPLDAHQLVVRATPIGQVKVSGANVLRAFWDSAAKNVHGYSFFPPAHRQQSPEIQADRIVLSLKERNERAAVTELRFSGELVCSETSFSHSKTPVIQGDDVLKKLARFIWVALGMARSLRLGLLKVSAEIRGVDHAFVFGYDPREMENSQPLAFTSQFGPLPAPLMGEADVSETADFEEEITRALVELQRDMFFPLQTNGNRMMGVAPASIEYSVEAVRRRVREVLLSA